MTALHNWLGYGCTDDAVGTVSYVAGEDPVDTTWKGGRGGYQPPAAPTPDARPTPVVEAPTPPPAAPPAGPRIVVATSMPGPEALLHHATHGLRELLRRGRLPFGVEDPARRVLTAAQQLRPLLGRDGKELAAMLATVSYVTARSAEECLDTACLAEAARLIVQRDALLAIASRNPFDAAVEEAAAQSRTWSTR